MLQGTMGVVVSRGERIKTNWHSLDGRHSRPQTHTHTHTAACTYARTLTHTHRHIHTHKHTYTHSNTQAVLFNFLSQEVRIVSCFTAGHMTSRIER